MRKRNTSFSATDVRSHLIHYEASELVIYCISRVENYPCVHNKIFLARSLYEFICDIKLQLRPIIILRKSVNNHENTEICTL